MMSTFQKLVAHMRNFIQFRFYMGLIDNIVAKCKYIWYHQHLLSYITTLVSSLFPYLLTPLCTSPLTSSLLAPLLLSLPASLLLPFCAISLHVLSPADVATLVGYTVVSQPFLDLTTPKYLNSTHDQRLRVRIPC